VIDSSEKKREQSDAEQQVGQDGRRDREGADESAPRVVLDAVGEERAEHRRDRGGAGGHDERVHEALHDLLVGEELGIPAQREAAPHEEVLRVVEAHDHDDEDRQVEERVAEPERHEDAARLAHRSWASRRLQLAHRGGRRIRGRGRLSHGAVLP
jgi:hypothetical protein